MALTKTGDPIRASIPFDLNRSGFVIGEGAGILILESLESALNRNAHICAKLLDMALHRMLSHHQPRPGRRRSRTGHGPAMQEGGRSKRLIMSTPCGTTPLNDKFETLSIKGGLSETAYRTSVSSTKS